MVVTETKYCTSYSNCLNALSPATTVEYHRRQRINFYIGHVIEQINLFSQHTFSSAVRKESLPDRQTPTMDVLIGLSDVEGRGLGLKQTRFSSRAPNLWRWGCNEPWKGAWSNGPLPKMNTTRCLPTLFFNSPSWTLNVPSRTCDGHSGAPMGPCRTDPLKLLISLFSPGVDRRRRQHLIVGVENRPLPQIGAVWPNSFSVIG